jgi:hypothetical protein
VFVAGAEKCVDALHGSGQIGDSDGPLVDVPVDGLAREPARPASTTSATNTATESCACTARGGKVVLVPLPPAVVARAIDRAVGDRTDGPILRNTLGLRMDRHAATRRLRHWPPPPASACRECIHMLRHTL